MSQDLGNLGTRHYIEIGSDVSHGIAQVKNEDRFSIRASVRFTKPDGSRVKDVDLTENHAVADLLDKQIRGGGSVAIIMDIDIPIPGKWQPLVDANNGNGLNAHVTLGLILTDGAGKEHLLDTASGSAVVDPKD